MFPDPQPGSSPRRTDDNDPANDPAVRARVLQQEAAAGHILIMPTLPNQTPVQKYEAGHTTLIAVARNQAPVDQLPQGARLILEGNHQVIHEQPLLYTVRIVQAYRPQKDGLIDAARCVFKIKDDYPGPAFNVEITPQNRPALEQAVMHADAMLTYQKSLNDAMDNLSKMLDPVLDIVYDMVTGAGEALVPAMDKLPAEEVAALRKYLTERYQKGVDKRRENAVRDAKQLGTLEQQAETSQREKLAMDLAHAWLQGQGQPGVPPPPPPVHGNPGPGTQHATTGHPATTGHGHHATTGHPATTGHGAHQPPVPPNPPKATRRTPGH